MILKRKIRNVDRVQHSNLYEKFQIVSEVQEDERVLDHEDEGAVIVRNHGKYLPVETA